MSWQDLLKRKLTEDEVRQYAQLHDERRRRTDPMLSREESRTLDEERKKQAEEENRSWIEKRDALRAPKMGTPLPEMQLLRWLKFEYLHPDVQGMMSRELTKFSRELDTAPSEAEYMKTIKNMVQLLKTTKHEWDNPKGEDMIMRKLKEFGYLPE